MPIDCPHRKKLPGLIRFQEVPHCLPIRKGGRVFFFSNKTFAVPAHGHRVLQLGISVLGAWGSAMDAVSSPGLVVHLKHQESRLWVIVENYLDRPQMLTYKTPLFSIETEIEFCWVPDKGRRRIAIKQGKIELTKQLDCRITTMPDISLTPSQVTAEGLKSVFPGLFAERVGCCNKFIVPDLDLVSALPRFNQPAARVSGPQETRELQLAVDNLIRENIVQESRDELPHLIPIFAIKKPNGTSRVVLDFRLFNSCCRLLRYTGTHRLWILSSIPPFCVGSQLDLRDSFHQIRLQPGMQRSFGFKLHNRYYFYKRLPQGWLNSPGFFVRALDLTLKAAEDRLKAVGSTGRVFSYVDDVLLLSASREAHAKDLAIVLDQFAQDGFTLRAEKCRFMVDSFLFLGYTLSSKGWIPNENLVGQLQQLTAPTTQKEWRAVAGWLHQLVPFLFKGLQVQQIFHRVRQTGKGWPQFLQALQQQMIRLHHQVPTGTYVIGIDASSLGWGATLSQNGQVLLCCSGLWSTPLQRHFTKAIDDGARVGTWSLANEWEAEGLRRALLVFQPIVWGLPVILMSDNAAVASFARPESCSPFIQRRLHVVLSICPQIRFVSGTANCLPDFLSRCQPFGCSFSELPVEARFGLTFAQTTTVSPPPIAIWNRLHSGHNGLLTMLHRSKLWNLPASRDSLIQGIRQCRVCQQFQQVRRDSLLRPIDLPDFPGQVLSLDFIGPVNRKWILVIVDQFSRMVRLQVVRGTSASIVREAIQSWITTMGRKPHRVHCDNATSFGLQLFEWLRHQQIQAVFASPYDHRSNGLVERVNREVNRVLGKLKLSSGVTEWWRLVDKTQQELNHSYHRGLGTFPSCVWNGDQQVLADVKKRTKALHAEMNRGRVASSVEFQTGQWVWMYRLKERSTGQLGKFDPPWGGPFKVLARPGKNTYVVHLTGSSRHRRYQVHGDFLRSVI